MTDRRKFRRDTKRRYVGSMHFFTEDLSFGLVIQPVPKERGTPCPVCGADLERIAGMGRLCKSCGYTEDVTGE